VVAREVRKMAKDVGALIEVARDKLSKLTGLKASSTVGAIKDEKGWRVSVEMLEKQSIPDQMDILATYEALLDDEGNLLSFERKSMRKRMETEVKT
jgi:CO dehydrogenase/acetyl-CoA synthase gamma subunit (corrinoid Fe-S protein)